MSCYNCHNSNGSRWGLGIVLAFAGLTALYLAAHTAGGGFYLHGLGLFGLCVLGVFCLIKRSFDDADTHGGTGAHTH